MPFPLSSGIICGEAIRLLLQERANPTEGEDAPHFDLHASPRPGMFGENVSISDTDLNLSLQDFADRFIRPAMRRLARHVDGVLLGDGDIELPFGIHSAANRKWAGVSMRVCICDEVPIGKQTTLWHQVKKHYDIAEGLLVGPVGIAVRFDVCKKGCEASLRIPDKAA